MKPTNGYHYSVLDRSQVQNWTRCPQIFLSLPYYLQAIWDFSVFQSTQATVGSVVLKLPLTSIQCRGYECVELYLHSAISLHGVHSKNTLPACKCRCINSNKATACFIQILSIALFTIILRFDKASLNKG